MSDLQILLHLIISTRSGLNTSLGFMIHCGDFKGSTTLNGLEQFRYTDKQSQFSLLFVELNLISDESFQASELWCEMFSVQIWTHTRAYEPESFYSPVGVLIINHQQDLGLADHRLGWLNASCRGAFSCRRWFSMRCSCHVLGHLCTFHHTGEGAEEAPRARGRTRGRARSRARGLRLARDAGRLPPLCGRGGRRWSGWSWRGRPLQIHHVAIGEVGHKAAVWQAPAKVVHCDGLVSLSGQRRWEGSAAVVLKKRKSRFKSALI